MSRRSCDEPLAYRHQRVQRLRRLVGRRSARADEGRFVIEGLNLLEEALKAHVPIEAVYLDAGWSSDRLAGLVAQCYEQGARVFELEAGVLARVAGTVTPQPVIAVVGMPVVHAWRTSVPPAPACWWCASTSGTPAMPAPWSVRPGPPAWTPWCAARERSTSGTPRPSGPRPVPSCTCPWWRPGRRPRS